VFEGRLEADAYDAAREAAPGWDTGHGAGDNAGKNYGGVGLSGSLNNVISSS
jgi:hypothetical protein